MSKVFLGVGHGGADSGAVGNGLKEKDLNLAIALACASVLSANGVSVMLSRKKDENDPLNEETKECNAFAPDLAVDIHNNAGGGDGAEAWYHFGGGVSKTLADNILSEIVKIGQNSRGAKFKKNAQGRDYYGFIRMTNAPAVIVETAFIDNATDIKIIDTAAEQQAMGEAIARGILKTLGITASAAAPAAPAAPAATPAKVAASTKYSVGDKVVYSSCYRASTDGINKAIILKAQKTGVITKIIAGARNPYLIGNGTCWVNDGDIRRKV